MLTSWSIPVAVTPVTEDNDQHEIDESRSDTTAGDREIELKGDQFEEMTDSKLKLNVFDLWALGITTALGGHFYLWNFALPIGMGSLLVATFIVGSGYVCLVLCMAELSGALPFAGGAYGITRVTLGSLPGFLVACFDSYQSMFYTMLCVLVMGLLIQVSTDTDKKWAPLWWFIIYTSYILMHTIGGKWYWRTMKTLSLGSFALLLIYLLGSIRFANLSEYAPLNVSDKDPIANVWFHGTALEFFQALPIACWFFLGVESLNLASHDAVDPKRDVPRAYISSISTLCCTSFATILVVCSIPPGINIVQFMISPMSFGYMLMFDIDLKKAIWLSMPAIYTSGFGFTYYYSSQVRAMGKSGLANSWLGYDVPYFNTPVPALIFGAVVGYGVGLRYHFYPALQHESIFGVGLLGAMLTYFSQFISFVAFRLYYPTIKRQFVSPLGIGGAIYGTMVFGIIFVAIAGLERSIGIIAFAIYVALLLIYYYLVVIKRQTFSEEEKTVLFKAYLMKTNRQKAGRIRVAHARARHSLLQSSSGSVAIAGDSNSGSGSGIATVGSRTRQQQRRSHTSTQENTVTTSGIGVDVEVPGDDTPSATGGGGAGGEHSSSNNNNGDGLVHSGGTLQIYTPMSPTYTKSADTTTTAVQEQRTCVITVQQCGDSQRTASIHYVHSNAPQVVKDTNTEDPVLATTTAAAVLTEEGDNHIEPESYIISAAGGGGGAAVSVEDSDLVVGNTEEADAGSCSSASATGAVDSCSAASVVNNSRTAAVGGAGARLPVHTPTASTTAAPSSNRQGADQLSGIEIV